MKRPLLIASTIALVFQAAVSFGAPVLAHRAEIRLDIAEHTLAVRDRFTIPEGVAELRLGPNLNIDAPGWRLVTVEGDTHQVFDLTAAGLAPGDTVDLHYTGTFFETVDGVIFSRENVGREIRATVSEEGVYLSAAAGWLAWAEGVLATHDLALTTPAGFETVTQGRRVRHEEIGGLLHTRWVAEYPSDGLTLVANRFVVHEQAVRDDIMAQTFFLEDDARLRHTYLERTGAYIDMYEQMIGPYPYAKFATVENWFPTGYGMPSYTLLGGQVLRLPFIPTTSFGHEICHNWWGNSVFVDLDEGNWCEGLTVYCADYHYKELESEAAAREYRRNLLKDYAAYVADPAQDFPLSEFKSRHSGATRAVGYGKSMMVFHMADRLVGREAFLNGLRLVAASHLFAEAGWSDFLAAFGADADHDLGEFGRQWLERAGAPELKLSHVEFGARSVSFTLEQSEPAYILSVPVRVTVSGKSLDHTMELSARSAEFEIEGEGITGLAVDPDYHLFRKLHPAEIEPTISQVLGADDVVFVLDGPDAPFDEAGRNFARAFSETDDPVVVSDGTLPGNGRSAVVLNPTPARLGALEAPTLTIAGKTAFVAGKRYDLKEFDLVYAAASPTGAGSCLVILSDSTHRLESLARRVGHYGKYSWLLLPKGQGRVQRGNWPAGESPLVAGK